MFSDSGDSFKVTGNGENRVLVITPEDEVESSQDCIVIMSATDGQWTTDFKLRYERIKAMKSCAEYLANGVSKDGAYDISFYGAYEQPKKVYCAFTEQPARAWTLISSFSLSNARKNAKSFPTNDPHGSVSSKNTNYRLNKVDMAMLNLHSGRWMTTCNFKLPQQENDNVDHAIASQASLDIMSYEGGGHCIFMESMAVRVGKTAGAKCKNCYARWWQSAAGGGHMHYDSGDNSGCYARNLRTGYHKIGSEDNFGVRYPFLQCVYISRMTASA